MPPARTSPMAIKDRLADVPMVGTAFAVQDRYKRDAGDQFAAAIGFFGFLSLFPLILLALSVTGFVLAGATDAEIAEVARSIEQAIPGFSAALGGGDDATGVGQALTTIIEHRGSGGVVGLVLLLVSGLRVVNSAQAATLVIFRIDRAEVSGIRRRASQVVALIVLGMVALLGVAAGSAIGVVTGVDLLGVMDVLAPVVATAGTFALDVLLFLLAYRLFATSAGPPTRALVPGALLGAVGWTLLKLFGATYVSGQVTRAGELYGALGGVIGLLLLLYLAGRLYVYGAELSAVRLAGTDPSPVDEPGGMGGAGGPTAVTSPEVGDVEPGAPLFPGYGAGESTGDATDRLGTRAAVGIERARPADRATAPAASPATQARLAAMPDAHGEGQGRHTLAFAVAVGAIAGLAGMLRPWDRD